MAFLRIEIDVDIWDKIEQKQQECIVGRGKLTGRSLIGIDKKGNPIMSKLCQLHKLKIAIKDFMIIPIFSKRLIYQEKTFP